MGNRTIWVGWEFGDRLGWLVLRIYFAFLPAVGFFREVIWPGSFCRIWDLAWGLLCVCGWGGGIGGWGEQGGPSYIASLSCLGLPNNRQHLVLGFPTARHLTTLTANSNMR